MDNLRYNRAENGLALWNGTDAGQYRAQAWSFADKRIGSIAQDVRDRAGIRHAAHHDDLEVFGDAPRLVNQRQGIPVFQVKV